jgi:hypothetical protein
MTNIRENGTVREKRCGGVKTGPCVNTGACVKTGPGGLKTGLGGLNHSKQIVTKMKKIYKHTTLYTT